MSPERDPLGVAAVLIGTFAPTHAGYVLAGPEATVRALVAELAPATHRDPDRHEDPWSIAIRAPLTPEVVVTAFRRRVAVSAGWGTAAPHAAALDLDRPDGLDLARRLGVALTELGIPSVIVPSEGGRAHLWLVADRTLPALAWRHALRAVLALTGLEGAADIELRPSSDHPGDSPFSGGTLRLPGSPHRRSGRQFGWLDGRGTALGHSLGDMLLTMDLADRDAIVAMAERHRPVAPPIRSPRRSAGPSPIEQFNAAIGVTAVLAREWGAPNAVPGRSIRCPAHDDRSPSLSIARDDSRAWCHAPACDLHGPDGAGHDAYSLVCVARGWGAA